MKPFTLEFSVRYYYYTLLLILLNSSIDIFTNKASAQSLCQGNYVLAGSEAEAMWAGSLQLSFPKDSTDHLDFSQGSSSLAAVTASGILTAANGVTVPVDAILPEGLSYNYLVELSTDTDTLLAITDDASITISDLQAQGLLEMPDTGIRIRYAGIMWSRLQAQANYDLMSQFCTALSSDPALCELLDTIGSITDLKDWLTIVNYRAIGEARMPSSIPQLILFSAMMERQYHQQDAGLAVPCYSLTGWNNNQSAVQLIDTNGTGTSSLIESYYSLDLLTVELQCAAGFAGSISFRDMDNDGLGNPNHLIWHCQGATPSGTVSNDLDQDDHCPGNLWDSCGLCFDLDDPQINYCLDPVWPGDVNDNGIVNNMDLLDLGLQMSLTGPARAFSSTEWISQNCINWPTELPASSANSKHADCDGNGLVDLDDQAAILQNYASARVGKTNEFESTAIPLFLEMPTSVEEGAAVTVPVILGTSAEPANEFYGVAASLSFDTTLVDMASVTISFSNSWLGEQDVDFIALAKHQPKGVIDLGISKVDQISSSGQGQIATASFIMIDDIAGKQPGEVDFEIWISSSAILRVDGEKFEPRTPSNKSSLKLENDDGWQEPQEQPNIILCQESCGWTFTSDCKIFEASIQATNGLLLQRHLQVNDYRLAINLCSAPVGIYLLQIETECGTVSRRIFGF